MRGSGILGSRGEILHASSRGWHEPPQLLDTLGAHTIHKAAWQDTRHGACQAALAMLTDPRV